MNFGCHINMSVSKTCSEHIFEAAVILPSKSNELWIWRHERYQGYSSGVRWSAAAQSKHLCLCVFFLFLLPPVPSVTPSPLALCLSSGMKTLLDAGRALEGKHFKCLHNYTSNNGFTHIHTLRHACSWGLTVTQRKWKLLCQSVRLLISVTWSCVRLCVCRCVRMAANSWQGTTLCVYVRVYVYILT